MVFIEPNWLRSSAHQQVDRVMSHFFVVDNPDFIETRPPVEVERAAVPGTDQDIEACYYHLTHDLRATMRALKHLPDWIRDDLRSDGTAISASTEGYFDLLRIHAERADQLLLDLRTYSRIGRKSDEPSPIGLEMMFRAALRSTEMPDTFSVDTNFEVETVVGPANDLHNLAIALVHNAWYHNDQPHGTVFLSAVEAGEFIEIVVGDNGPGIPEADREKVFNMLVTLRPRDEVEGSGLGLSIVSKVVAHLEGSVFIRDRKAGRGTEVVVRLPQRPF